MRPQARVLLAIGAVVLAGLVAWVLIPRGGDKTAGPLQDNSTLAPPPLPLPTATTATAEGPSTMPDLFGALTPTTVPGTPADNMSATGPADRNNSNDPWDTALNEGRRPSLTSNAFGGRVERGSITPPVTGDVAGTRTGPVSPHTYTVLAGDSLYAISQRVLGSPKYVAAIQKANPKVDPRRLRVGQVLNIPDVSGASTPATRPGISRPAGESGRDASTGLGVGKTYKVQPGDTLRKIAIKQYGNAKMWEKIYALNREAIGSSPANLRAGMTLRLPEGAASR